MTDEEAIAHLAREGYVIVEGCWSPQEVASRKRAVDPWRQGVNRLRAPTPEILEARRVLSEPHPRVESIVAGVLRDHRPNGVGAGDPWPRPTASSNSLWHRDLDQMSPKMFRVQPGDRTKVVAIWALDSFHPDNAATEVVPRSHVGESDALPVICAMPAGSVLLFPAQTLHRKGPVQNQGMSRFMFSSRFQGIWR